MRITGDFRRRRRQLGPNLLATLGLAGLILLASAAAGQQASPSAPQGSIRISGMVAHPVNLSKADLSALKKASVTVSDEHGTQAVYAGVPLVQLLARAGAPLGKELRGQKLKLYVVVKAADGYEAVFALAELDPEFTDKVVLLADQRDGSPLSAQEGPFRIVIPGEKRHARWVRQVTVLEVGQAK